MVTPSVESCAAEVAPDWSIYELIFEKSGAEEDTPILIDSEDTAHFYTLSSMRSAILKFAGLLKQKYDWKKGDVLVVCAENSIHYAVPVHASVTIGGIGSAADHQASAEDISKNLRLVNAKLVVTDQNIFSKANKAAQLAGVPHPVITFDEMCTAIRQGDIQPPQPVRYTPEELRTTPAYLYFTSGTTGDKKAVILSHRNLVASLYFAKVVPWPKPCMTYTEFHHGSQLILTMHHAFYTALPVYIVNMGNKIDVRRICETVQKHKIRLLVVQPWISQTLAKEPWVADYDLSSLKCLVSAGAKTDASIIHALHERFGIALINMIAMTEAIGYLSPSWEASMEGSLGVIGPRTLSKIVDADGNGRGECFNIKPCGSNLSITEVPSGQIGELCIKSETVTMGYYNNPEATKATIDEDGYIHTGDLFRVDERGYHYFEGRSKDLIKYHLHHLYPKDVEEVLMKDPRVADCCVVGVYSETEATELVTAFVQLSEEHASDQVNKQKVKREIQEFVDDQVPDPRRLRGGIYLVDSFQRTALGKVKKNLLIEKYINKTTAD
ncbi:hypothetical protein BCR43DRAFT_561776 [Syncephalastrum racemosum]|uniref:AMP-dependent synthetase/ligase domain-containing protein n=1 Tax=Syncephalastrum racemosum TaxID=13706 RepID=A0A1X2HQG8_SYNRA|nr:hypothetical protein BCR43DRAFT_561776 [Syncephalastrum racemosum]